MAALALAAGSALATAAYPAKTVTMVVAYPPGGDTDAMARLYADKLSARLKQPVIVENRPGAGGVVAPALSAARRRTATRCCTRPTLSRWRRWCSGWRRRPAMTRCTASPP
jgi:tripartite-type tricarboxylate transporter receptor subunit TctC